MADASGAPRRVSMAYILGFSNKPFKDGGPPAPSQPPPPRHPSAFKKMVTTPGGVIEWTASDGRRGRLTGQGKPRLTPANLAQVPSGKVSVKATSKKDAAEDDVCGFLGGAMFDEAPAATANDKTAQNDTSANNSWTAEQDKKLMNMKNENKSWTEIVEDIGKDQKQCKDRFNKIKPTGWRPENSKGGGKQKQGKQRGEKGQKDATKKEDKKQAETSGGGWDNPFENSGNTNNATADGGFKDGSGGDPWNDNDNGGWDLAGDDKKEGNGESGGMDWGMGGVSGDNKNDEGFNPTGDDWGAPGGGSGNNKNDEGFNPMGDGWGAPGEGSGDNGVANGWDTTAAAGADAGTSWGDTKNNESPGANAPGDRNNGFTNSNSNSGGKAPGNWDTGFTNLNDNSAWHAPPAPKGPSNKGSKPPSKKAASHAGFKQRSTREPEKPARTAPTEYELTPDSTFSANDLRLVARILQQDCQMVWNRVSWRFRDKTGRNLDPDVFEKKITGRVEGKDSERGGK
ncbi:hypothetical protein EKO04_007653 [Ascochyta lentis]|uniref:Myb-like domain-containing protein n=1 Tax=Ascochyta lentis TaxID=205686 RepID=A0A8H7J0E5_9PLEO|nr:hypothetical protein EKO04_007653 [Ascochyta lentis]